MSPNRLNALTDGVVAIVLTIMVLELKIPAEATLRAVLAVLHTWPLVLHPGRYSLNYNADTQLNEWILAWVAHQLPRAPAHLFEANIFYPARDTLAFSEPLIVPAILGFPVRLAGGSPVLVSNLLKSNCLVTGQPDWGSVQIRYAGPQIEQGVLLRYLVSLRNHNEFHEQCVERIFMDNRLLAQERLWVGAGSPNHLAGLPPGELVRLSRAEPADVSAGSAG